MFAEQAKGAGVEVTINNIPPGDYYGPGYLQYVFGQSSWVAGTVTGLMQASVGPNATYNETHFSNPTFDELFTESQGTLDEAMRDRAAVRVPADPVRRGWLHHLGPVAVHRRLVAEGPRHVVDAHYPLGGGDFRMTAIMTTHIHEDNLVST